MADDCILYWKQKVTVGIYTKMVAEKDVNGIAEFISGRFTERYFAPLEASKAKSGFCLMAVSCLMIEALQCFWEGLPRTPKSNGADLFRRFFDRNSNMGIPSGLGGRFYGNVRNGILHQAETTDGWKIRLGGTLLA